MKLWRQQEWENDDYICRGHILNGMSDSLFDIYQNFEYAKELWDSLESKYMVEDASSKKFLDDKVAWWVDSGATSHVCKDLYWFKEFQPIDDGSVVKIGNVATEPIKGIGSFSTSLSASDLIRYFIIWCIMSNSSVIDGDLYSSMSESEEEDVENSFFEGGESSSSVHDAQYFDDIIGEHVYKPDVPDQLIPFKGLIFKSLKLAIKMYSEYAEIGGFDKKKSCDTLGTSGVRRKQNSNSRAIGCQAKIIFESVYGTPDYKVFQFDELHDHPLEKRSDLKKARQMSYSEKDFIVRASTSKIGPTMAHKLRASLRGGYEFVKTKVVDYKNLRRDINRVIAYKDAQMIVNTMNDRRAHYPNYAFEFNCQDDVLDCMFWADEMEKAYYAEFGDVISFDATFRTNKYRMVFVSFTAIDHHKKSLLKAFLKTHGKEPTLVLTDQDATIKQAVENVFRNSKHRLCMWHIMKKLKKKISDDLFTNTDFRKRFSKLVWDINMKPDVFEVKWGLLMKEFNLEDTRWFEDMFTIRDSWIPRYFSDIPMCGLMKTTSRSESMNSFFNTYSESGNLLLNFMMNYDTAIQKQRNTQRELDRASKKASYKMQTPREIELQASKVEIKAEEKEINCSCEHFKCIGVLCRHAFTIMMRCGVKEIPERYILKRWRKDVISRNYRFSSVQSDSGDCENVKLVNDSYYSFESCLDIVTDDKKRLTLFAEKQQMLLKEFESDYISPGLKSKTDGEVVCKLLGVTIPIPEEINIHVPEVQSNKGSGIKKRIPSACEVAYENSKKEHRMCPGCGKRVPHNLRTCLERVGAAKSAKDS
ncbi:protein FAR1-RELATED SEQUENCE 5-like [Lactuca sativa]|uniref:protein FAR1-RELATED SEQUENCE 5-like n=1 Tax=Lactuca sativa TaxID=4236 RepID=UPI0022AFCBCC|nr:protein FAR1-RELATED SEQUENCE 5-like [Lactuca sativa]